MSNRSSFSMETNQKSSRQTATNRKSQSKHKEHNDSYDQYDRRGSTYAKKEKYQNWKYQTTEGWDD